MKRNIVSLFLLLSACAQPPSAEIIARADYGAYPSNFQEIIKTYMGNILFDPYSAVYENWRGPSRGYSGGNFIETKFGYRVCVDINAKNRLGGYVGRKHYYFLIKNRVVVRDLGAFAAQQLCDF